MSSESNGIAHPKRHAWLKPQLGNQEGQENQHRFDCLWYASTYLTLSPKSTANKLIVVKTLFPFRLANRLQRTHAT
jgi:hypothetical protein